MQYPGPFSSLNLMMMPQNERTCIFEDELVLADNFNESGAPTDLSTHAGTAPFIASPYPFKIEFTMVLYCLEGTMRVRLNLTEYELHRNDMLFALSGSIGQCMEIASDCQVAIIAFASDWFLAGKSIQIAVHIRNLLLNNAVLRLSEEEGEEWLEIYRAMRKKVQRPDFLYKREVLDGYMQVLFAIGCQRLIPQTSPQQAQPQKNRTRIFDLFLRLVEEHHSTERKIGFYADRLCVTPKYLSQAVFAASGRHAGDWIRDHVILEAKALLKSGQYSVQQVSDMLNFANQSFFGVYFKRAVGCSPSKYMNGQ